MSDESNPPGTVEVTELPSPHTNGEVKEGENASETEQPIVVGEPYEEQQNEGEGSDEGVPQATTTESKDESVSYSSAAPSDVSSYGYGPAPVGPQVPTDQSKPKETGRMFVGKLVAGITEEHIRQYFSQFGGINEVFIPKRRDGSGMPQPYGFVTFEDKQVMEHVMSMPSHHIMGNEIRVNSAQAKSNTDSTSGGGGGGSSSSSSSSSSSQQTGFAPDGHARMFVGQLPEQLSNEDLQQYFSQYGEVADVFTPKDRAGKTDKAYGFVTFKLRANMMAAISVNSGVHNVHGHELRVKEAALRQSAGGAMGPSPGVLQQQQRIQQQMQQQQQMMQQYYGYYGFGGYPGYGAQAGFGVGAGAAGAAGMAGAAGAAAGAYGAYPGYGAQAAGAAATGASGTGAAATDASASAASAAQYGYGYGYDYSQQGYGQGYPAGYGQQGYGQTDASGQAAAGATSEDYSYGPVRRAGGATGRVNPY